MVQLDFEKKLVGGYINFKVCDVTLGHRDGWTTDLSLDLEDALALMTAFNAVAQGAHESARITTSTAKANPASTRQPGRHARARVGLVVFQPRVRPGQHVDATLDVPLSSLSRALSENGIHSTRRARHKEQGESREAHRCCSVHLRHIVCSSAGCEGSTITMLANAVACDPPCSAHVPPVKLDRGRVEVHEAD